MKKVLLLLILASATVLRFYNNTAIALWHDEAFSALYIKYGWGEMMHRIILDVHPPLYYIVLRLWSYIFGDSLLSLRGFSILLGTLTVLAGYVFVKKAFKSQNLALLAAFFLAINPFQIQYALEARMYTLGTFLVMFSSWLLLKALENKNKKTWIIYGVFAAASLYTHYYLLFSVLAQGLYALYHIYKNSTWRGSLRDNQLVNLILAGITSVVLYIPWIPAFLEQLQRVQGGYWIPPMDRWSIPGTIWKIAMGGQGINHSSLVLVTLISIFLILYFLRKYKDDEKWLVVSGLIIPFAAAVVLSMQNDIYLDRYFVFASLYFSILLALALSAVPKQWLRRTLVCAFIAISLYAFWKNWTELGVKDPGSSVVKKPGMAAGSAYLADRIGRQDKIYVGSSFVFFTFKYYNHTGITPKLISGSPLSGIPHFAGTAILTDEDLVLNDYIFSPENFKQNEIIWLVWTTGWGGSKPNVPGNWSKISEESWSDSPGFKGDLYISQYSVQ
ncbi:MAG: glycosyltransferase family 39 protein [Candidatus Doudnabacteria bacterium]|nr:glycosyltransferase family 39 protein [Candidatus Doudnabacteria bacterium]